MPAENSAHTAFADGNNLLVRTFANKAVTTTARTGYVSLVLDVTTERPSYQVDLAKSAGDKAARFITVLYPASDASAETVSAEFIDEEFSETAARISGDGRRSDLPHFHILWNLKINRYEQAIHSA